MPQRNTPVTAWTVLALAWPALGVLAATPLYLLLDTAVVGRLGAVSLAALAAGAAVLSTVTTQLTFLSYGTTARAARFYGQGDHRRAVYEGIQATWVALGIGSLLAGGVALGAPWLAQALAHDPEVAAQATSWLRVASLAIIPALIVMAGNGWMRGMSNTRAPFLFTLIGVIPMALTVPWSVHRFGLVGSAWANVGGEVVIASCFLIALLRTWRHYSTPEFPWTPQPRVMMRQLVLGRDLILRSLSFQVAFLSAAAVAGRMGPASLGAHQILLQVWFFLSLVLDSVAIAAQALVGAALGAGDAARARAVPWVVLRFSLVGSAILSLVLLLGVGILPRLFTDDSTVLDTIHAPWLLIAGMVIVGGVVFALDGVLLGASDVAFLRTLTIVSVVAGFIPLVWISLAAGWGLFGVWCGIAVSTLIRAVGVVWRFRGERWHAAAGHLDS